MYVINVRRVSLTNLSIVLWHNWAHDPDNLHECDSFKPTFTVFSGFEDHCHLLAVRKMVEFLIF